MNANLYRFLDKRVDEESTFLQRAYRLSAEAAGKLAGQLAIRLKRLTASVVGSLYVEEIKRINPLAEYSDIFVAPEQKNEAAGKLSVKLLKDMDIFNEYPKLSHYAELVSNNFRRFVRDFFLRLTEYRSGIEYALLEGRLMGDITSFSSQGADCHLHGASAMRVETEGGSFYYKPRDCSMELMYNEIVEAALKDTTLCASIINGDGFAFEETIRLGPVDSEADVAGYYRNFGSLLSLFGALGSNDMHYENIIASGIYPVAVDLETILTPLPDVFRDIGIASPEEMNPITSDLLFSTAGSMVLPMMLQGKVQMSPLIREDALSLPELNGRRIPVFGYEEAFIQGYLYGYDRIYDKRQEVLHILKQYKKASARYILRTSSYYAIKLNKLHSPDFLQNEEKARKEFDKLGNRFSDLQEDQRSSLTGWETECMEEGDIPYLSVRSEERHLYGEPGREALVKDFFYCSSIEHAGMCLGRMDKHEKEFELSYLRARFRQAASSQKSDGEQKACECTGSLSNKEAKEEAVRLFEQIVKGAVISSQGDIFFLSREDNMIPEYVPGFGKGIQGMSLFFSALKEMGAYAADPLDRMLEEARKDTDRCLEGSRKSADIHRFPIGVDRGLGGHMLSPVLTSRQAENLLQLLEKADHLKDDVFEGKSGLIIGLDRLKERKELSDRAVSYMERFGYALINSRDDPVSRLSGLFHGQAGKAYALALCYEATGRDIFMQHTGYALDHEYAMYEEKLEGWPDLTGIDRPLIPGYGLRTGAGGILLSAVRACRAGCGRMELVRLAADSVIRKGLLDTDELSCGNSGSVLGLISAYELTGDGDYRKEAGRILKAMAARASQNGGYRVIPVGYRIAFEPSFLEGYAGIGYALLCYAQKAA